MTYRKPEVVVLESAISAIQGTSDSKVETVLDGIRKHTSVGAYEADE